MTVSRYPSVPAGDAGHEHPVSLRNLDPAPRYAAQMSTVGLGGPVLAHRRQVAPIIGVVLALVGIAVLHPIPVVVTCRPQVGVRFDVGYIEQDLTVRRCVLAHLVVEVFRYLACRCPVPGWMSRR